MAYEPKLDPTAVLEGYLNTDPNIKGEIVGYLYGEQVKNYSSNEQTQDNSR